MKRFKFKLEAVRLDRKRGEDLKLREWSIVNRMLAELRNEKTAMEERMKSAFREMTDLNAMPRLSTGLITELESFIQGLRQRIEWKGGEIARAEKFVERKRVEWMAARQKRMILDKLKEKKVEEHLEEARWREDRDLDDLNLMRARIKAGEEGEKT